MTITRHVLMWSGVRFNLLTTKDEVWKPYTCFTADGLGMSIAVDSTHSLPYLVLLFFFRAKRSQAT